MRRRPAACYAPSVLNDRAAAAQSPGEDTMRRFDRADRPAAARAALVATVLATLLGVAACAPQNTNTTYSGQDIGRTASVSFGTIVSMRPVAVEGGGTGLGAIGGAAAGGVAGSFIGNNDVRGNILGAIGGAIVGGVVGSAVEGGLSQGQAVEFIIRDDSGQTISVVQTNEERFQVGERVIITRGARTRLARGAPPSPGAYPPPPAAYQPPPGTYQPPAAVYQPSPGT